MPQYIWDGIFSILNVLVPSVVLALFASHYQKIGTLSTDNLCHISGKDSRKSYTKIKITNNTSYNEKI